MKKIIISILVTLLFLPISVNAASGSTSLVASSTTVKVGKVTYVYVRLNSSHKIEGADVTYAVSGNISVSSVSVGNGLIKFAQDGKRYVLVASNPIASGSNLLVLGIKGTAVGSGTVTVTNLKATVDGQTIDGGSKSISIKVNPLKTEAELKAEEEAKKKAEEEAKKKAEAEAKALSEATELVVKAEKEETKENYDEALKKVNALASSSGKTDLLKRLEVVKFNYSVKEACPKCEECKQVECVEEKNNENLWIILCGVLVLSLVLETIYIVVNKDSKEKTKKN